MLRDWQSVCRHWHGIAIASLKENGRTPFMLHIYPLASSEAIAWVEMQGLTDEARARLRLIRATLRDTNPAAVLISSDTWQASDKFWKHYGLDSVPAPEPRNTRYLEILNRDYKGSLEYVPDELKGEALVTTVKGQRFRPITFFTFYHHENGKVVIDETREKGYGIWNIVPDWWESVLQ